MSEFKVLFETLQRSLTNDEFVKLTLSKPMRKSEGLLNVYVRLFKVDGEDVFELKYRHAEENEFLQFSLEGVMTEVEKLLMETFRAATLFTLSEDLIVMVSKKKLVSYRDNAPSFKNKLPEIPMQS
ncbi:MULTISPECIES: hypothetical protein [unclassified Polaribacter]|uniref:hypothetical protein n=1 Tax=unclassified Polaribacter TaxID=196858 RepID=UPI001407EC07|nr:MULTISPECIES: hypothetical protein [unclassified Polaribacter]